MELYTFGQLSDQAKQVAENEIRALVNKLNDEELRKAKNNPDYIQSANTCIEMSRIIVDRIDMVFGLHPWFDVNGKYYGLADQND